MLWRAPTFFWLLPAVLALGVLLVLLLRRRAAALRAFADAPLVARLAPDVDERRPRRRLILRIAALAVLIVALAGPKWGFHWQEVHREGIDLIVALDTSRSMLATDVKPNRLERAKLAIMDLVPLLQGDRIGLVAFACSAFLECPLTLDYAAFERSLHSIEVGIIPRGGTALARAIDTSLGGFEAREGKYNALILITDGEDHEGDVKEAAQRAADQGVKIYTVGIGTAEGELLPLGKDGFVKDRSGQVVKSRLNDQTLKDIAIKTGGAYVQGLGPSLGLDQVFRDHIATMERRELASTLERRYEERFQIPLAVALALLAAEALMPLRRGTAGPRRRWWPRRAGEPARRQAAAAVLLVCTLPALFGFFDPPGDRAAEGNALYAAGKYEDAASRYGEGLIDAPASPLLQFNLATALYKEGKYDEAITALNKVAASGEAQWVARANYNLGNAHYRLGANAETSDPQAAIKAYEEALACYKRSMVADAADPDPKANHEFVSRKLDELKKRLEEQKQQQEQQQHDQQQQAQDEQQKDQQQQQEQGQQDQQQQQNQEKQQQQAGEQQQQQEQQPQQQAGQEQQQEQQQQAGEQDQQQQQQAAGEQPPQEQQAQPGGAAQAEAGEAADEQDRRAAQAVLDTARGEELDPSDMQRQVGVAGVGEAAQDW